jgi:hypothetical protein
MAYKFQSGDATLSGSVTIVSYQDLLFGADGTSNIGEAAKEVGVIYTTRQTASVGLSGSAIYANKFYGNGSGITGLASDSAKVTGSNQNVDLQLVLVQQAGDGETLAVDNAGAIAFNPSSNLLSSTGKIATSNNLSASLVVAGKSVLVGQNGQIGAAGDADLLKLATNKLTLNGVLSQSIGNAITGSQFLFKSAGGAGNSALLDGNGFALTNASDQDSIQIAYGGTLSASSNANIGGTLTAAKNKFSVNAQGDATAVDLILKANNGVIYLAGDSSPEKISCNGGNNVNINAGGDVIFNPGGLNVLPENDGTIDLGSSAKEWKDLFVDGIAYLDQVNTAVDRGPVYATLLSASTTLTVGGASALQALTVTTVSASSTLKVAAGAEIAKNKFVVATDGDLSSKGNIDIGAVDSKLAATDVAIATTDYLYFADATDSDKIMKDAVDDVMKIGMSLLSETPITLANDFLVFSDANDSNFGKRIKMKSFIAAAADGTTITSSNGVLSVIGAQNIDVNNKLGNASYQITKAGMNYATASIATNVTYTLPASPTSGDIVYIKLANVNAGKHAVISASAAHAIDGGTTLTASSPYAGISLVYTGASTGWRVF